MDGVHLYIARRRLRMGGLNGWMEGVQVHRRIANDYTSRVISLHTRAYSLLLLLFRFPTPTRWAAHFNQTVVAPFFSPCTCTNCDHCAGFQHKGLGEDDVTMNCLLKRIIFTFFRGTNVLLNFLRFSFTTTFYQH